MFRINRAIKTRPEVKEIIIFKDEHIQKIFGNLTGKNSNFMTAIYILFYTGLRSSDILTITSDRINLNQNLISYYSPKRKKYRTIPFHPELKPILEKRMSEVSGSLIEYNNLVNLGKAVKRYFKNLGLEDYYTARTFRKTFITLCRSRFNMDASVVRELVGHEHGNTTDRYYNQINMNTIRKEFKKFRFRF
jgi:integrase